MWRGRVSFTTFSMSTLKISYKKFTGLEYSENYEKLM